MSHNGGEPINYAGQYSTDVVAARAREQLAEALSHEEEAPFFVTIAPIAPHSVWIIEPENNLSHLLAPEVAGRHKDLFADYKLPRDGAFNAEVEGAVGWIKTLEPLNQTVLEYNDYYQRRRLQALQAVGEMVAALVSQLDAAGVLNNTYIFYSTDNGYHLSSHSMHPGKECGYDTDIHIPMFVRGPEVEAGVQIDTVTSHNDVSSTLLRIAGVEKGTDGSPMPLVAADNASDESQDREHASVEYWGPAIPEGFYGTRTDLDREAGKFSFLYANNTYKGFWLVGKDYSLYYSVWCTNETELYNLLDDPFQVKNLAADPNAYHLSTIAGRSLAYVMPRLDALIMVLKTCKVQTCTSPWTALHPDGDVRTLSQALEPTYDDFYEDQPKMAFYDCSRAYYADIENQESVKTYGKIGSLVDQTFDYTNHWHLLT